MKRLGGSLSVAAWLVLGLGGCESFRLFNDYETAESADVEAAPWPRLVDVPPAPPPGTFTEAVPDPVQGIAVQTELSLAASGAGTRRSDLAAPVLAEADRERLGARDPAREAGRSEPVLSAEDRAALARAEAAQAARQSGTVPARP